LYNIRYHNKKIEMFLLKSFEQSLRYGTLQSMGPGLGPIPCVSSLGRVPWSRPLVSRLQPLSRPLLRCRPSVECRGIACERSWITAWTRSVPGPAAPNQCRTTRIKCHLRVTEGCIAGRVITAGPLQSGLAGSRGRRGRRAPKAATPAGLRGAAKSSGLLIEKRM
jgi:hypothetical protein